jgi:hypothetical protein
VIGFAVQAHEECDELIIEAFIKGFEEYVKKDENYENYEKFKLNAVNYINENIKNTQIQSEGYYGGLVRRFAKNLFEILIGTPFKIKERYDLFDKNRNEFYALSIFTTSYKDRANALKELPSLHPMYYQILFHEQLKDEIDKKNIPTNKAIDIVERIIGKKQIDEMFKENKKGVKKPKFKFMGGGKKVYKYLKKFISRHSEYFSTNLRNTLSPLSPYVESENDNQIKHKKKMIIKFLKDNLKSNKETEKEAEFVEITEAYYGNAFNIMTKDMADAPDEFSEDIEILKDILNNQVINAISVETPFIDLVNQKIDDIKNSLIANSETEDDGQVFSNFIEENAALLLGKGYDYLMNEKEIREGQREVAKEILKMKEAIPKVNN